MASRIPAAHAPSKKTASPTLTYPSRSHVSTFVRCLHLLDLAALEDWPVITELTLSTKAAQQNGQQRGRAVEWSLYRLFQKFDASLTKDKLDPFFPPASNLQSMNLRAALYRCLIEMKKEGVLGGHIQLRKTMLDECKGEKFEELLATFAMIVLRKVMVSRGMCEDDISGNQVLPLLLAYRNSLQNNLYRRQTAIDDHRNFHTRLQEASLNLDRRREELEARPPGLHSDQVRTLEKFVHSSWVGNPRWTELLITGRPALPVFEDPTNVVTSQEGKSQSSDSAPDLLQDLNLRTKQHRGRLTEWQVLAKDLTALRDSSRGVAHEKVNAPAQASSRSMHFTRHKELHLGHSRPSQTNQQTTPAITPAYQELLNGLRGELTTITKPGHTRKSQANPNVEWADTPRRIGPVADVQILSSTDTALRDRSNMVLENAQPSNNSEEGQALMSSTAFKSGAGGSDVGVTQDVGVEIDRLHIADSPTTVSSPISSLPDDLTSSIRMTEAQSSPPGGAAMSAFQIAERSTTPVVPDEEESDEGEMPASPIKEWMSLVQRTRASMSDFSHYKQPLEPQHQTANSHLLRDVPEEPIPNSVQEPSIRSSTPEQADQRATLLERTRLSMSLLSTAKPRRGRLSNVTHSMSHHQRRVSMFPVNQFETPGKPRRESEFGPDSESSTPREKLFDDAADYASVFKSRPKLAQSPRGTSPDGDTIGFDSILEQDTEGLELVSDGEDDGYSYR